MARNAACSYQRRLGKSKNMCSDGVTLAALALSPLACASRKRACARCTRLCQRAQRSRSDTNESTPFSTRYFGQSLMASRQGVFLTAASNRVEQKCARSGLQPFSMLEMTPTDGCSSRKHNHLNGGRALIFLLVQQPGFRALHWLCQLCLRQLWQQV